MFVLVRVSKTGGTNYLDNRGKGKQCFDLRQKQWGISGRIAGEREHHNWQPALLEHRNPSSRLEESTAKTVHWSGEVKQLKRKAEEHSRSLAKK